MDSDALRRDIEEMFSMLTGVFEVGTGEGTTVGYSRTGSWLASNITGEPGVRTDAVASQSYDRSRRSSRRAQGLCHSCDTPAVPGRSRCQPHLEQERKRAADAKARKQQEVSHG